MYKLNAKLEEVLRHIKVCFPNKYVSIDITVGVSSIDTRNDRIRAYVSDFKFTNGNSFSPYCATINEFVENMNLELKNVPNWKPVKTIKEPTKK